MSNERALFATKLGGVFAAVGSAVGLGNIWRFPYETGTHGGAAFLLVYLACVLVLGTPLLLAELTLGRATHLSPIGTFKKLAPGSNWYLLGYLGAFCMILIVAFYGVVAGWTLCYTVNASMSSVPDFVSFSTSLWSPLGWMTLFFVINGAILLGGVRKGIERASNILMPVLALMLLVLCVNSLTLDNASEGLKFLFYPDFSKIDSKVIVSAMGQSFFSISVGICCLLTYGSYLPNSTKLGKSALTITLLDTLFAVLSGIIIFPACFAYGVQPNQGPGLAFITLPDVFQQMPGGMLWCFGFFLLLVVAALTSSLSMLETPTAILQEEFHMSRKKAVLFSTTIGWLLSILCALSFCPLFADTLKVGDMIIFDLFDKTTANVIMPFSAMLMAVFVGWVMDKKLLRDNINNFRKDGKSVWYYWPFILTVRFIAPLCILLIFLHGMGVI